MINKAKNILGAIVVISFLAGCAGSTKVSDIESQTQKYKDKEVTIKGKVVNTLSLPLVSKGLAQVNDGSGTIWVKPIGVVPAKGDKVKVKGILKIGATVLDKDFGLIVIEQEKKD